MAKGYLSPSRILSKDEYEEYKFQQEEARYPELKQKLESGRQNLKRMFKQQAYDRTRTGKFASLLKKGFETARPGGVTQALYRKQIPITSQNVQQEYPSMPRRTLRGSSGGKVGRPRGTYDKRYANVGGVYMWRKLQAAKLREQALQLRRRYEVTPQQQMVINRFQTQQQYTQQNPEGRVIPSTSGEVFLDGIMDEINRATNLVG